MTEEQADKIISLLERIAAGIEWQNTDKMKGRSVLSPSGALGYLAINVAEKLPPHMRPVDK